MFSVRMIYFGFLLTGSRKLYAEERLAENNEAECAFYLSEAVSASVRTLAVYRDEQIKASGKPFFILFGYLQLIVIIWDL